MSPAATAALRNTVVNGDCVAVMRTMESASVDFILTDPPYLVRYRSRNGETIANDDRDGWLEPAFAEMYRVLKPDSFCVSFYGWNAVDRFVAAWRKAGFQIVGHLVFPKKYASSSRYLKHQHEQAYLLAKGNAPLPESPMSDVIDWRYTQNRLHPTQKPLVALLGLVQSFSRPGQLVLDPFCGSGSTLVAAKHLKRDYLGIELSGKHCGTAGMRLAIGSQDRIREAAG